MIFNTIFYIKTLEIVDRGFYGDVEKHLKHLPGYAAIKGVAPEGCMYVKKTEGEYSFDLNRKPDMPEPNCAWEKGRWVTKAEQRDRYNKFYESQLSAIDQKKIRALAELAMNDGDSSAVKRLQDYEAQAVELRDRLWRDGENSPPENFKTKEI